MHGDISSHRSGNPSQELSNVLTSSLRLLRSFCPGTGVGRPVRAAFRTLFSQMLPGVSSCLMKLLKATSPQVSSSSKALALSAWSAHVAAVLGDGSGGEDGEGDSAWSHKAREENVAGEATYFSFCYIQYRCFSFIYQTDYKI